MKLWPKLTVLAIFLTNLASAHATDLIETWRSALSYDPSIAAARSALLAGQEKETQGRAGLLPQANLSANATHRYQNNTSSAEATAQKQSNKKALNYQLTASQALYNSSAYAQYQQGKQNSQKAHIQFQLAQQTLILKVAQAYFDTLLAQEYIQQINAQKKATTQQMEQAKKSFELGITTITDFKEAQARFDEILANEIAAQNDLIIKQNALMQIAQVDPEHLATIDPQFIPTPPTPNDLDNWLQKADENSLEIQASKLDISIAKEEIEKYRLLKSPTVSLEAGYSKQRSLDDQIGTNGPIRGSSSTVSLILNVPLSTGGYRSSKLREAAALSEKSRQDLEAIIRQVRHKTKTAFLGVNSGIAQINALNKALQSNQSLVDATLLSFEVGVRTTEDILSAQEQYYIVKYKLAEARVNYLLNRLRLSESTGTLQEQNLEQINQWLIRKQDADDGSQKKS